MIDQPQPQNDPPEYEERYLAFVDILGWSKTVEKSATDPALRAAVHKAAQMIALMPISAQRTNEFSVQFREDMFPSDIRVSHFSDTFVLTTPVNDIAEVYLTIMLCDIAQSLLACGHYTRGAIVRGLVHHSGNAIYGPAVLEAYDLESRTAIYPRIIVTPLAAEAFSSYLQTDADGLRFLDILFSLPSGSLETLRAFAERKELQDAGNMHLLAKHRWFKAYVLRLMEDQRRAQATSINFSDLIGNAIKRAEESVLNRVPGNDPEKPD